MPISFDTIRKHPFLSRSFRVILGAVFIFAGVEKIFAPADFAQAIRNYMILPLSVTNLVAIVLPWLELFCGFFLLAGLFIRASALLITILNLVFIFALLSVMVRGLDISCGCFGSVTPVDWLKIAENVVLLSMSLHLLFSAP